MGTDRQEKAEPETMGWRALTIQEMTLQSALNQTFVKDFSDFYKK